jgi:hypothetical protein
VSNEDLVREFECGNTPGFFHHDDHVRLAFAYLSQYPVLTALEKFTLALQRLAIARGKPNLYHETITYAYFFLIRERMSRHASSQWEEFARRNPDLLIWKNGVLSRYYHDTTLHSDLARSVFLLPDKCAASSCSDEPSKPNS